MTFRKFYKPGMTILDQPFCGQIALIPPRTGGENIWDWLFNLEGVQSGDPYIIRRNADADPHNLLRANHQSALRSGQYTFKGSTKTYT